MNDRLSELEDCKLCEWQCETNRLEGELGVCRIGKPEVASAMLHPAPPESYTVFMSGCNFRCLNCQNHDIAHYPDSLKSVRGFTEPEELAKEVYRALYSSRGKLIGADRIFFSGGAPTPSLPYIEEVVKKARKLGKVKVNYDTNGFLTKKSLERVIDFTTSITFDIKAYHDDVHRALTGAPVEPVLRNAKYVGENAKDKLWEFRVLLIPGISEGEIKPLSNFISKIDPELPLNFLAFRPSFVLNHYRGATREFMNKAVDIAEETGLKNVSWSGHVDLPGRITTEEAKEYEKHGGKIAGAIAKEKGCMTHPRNCVDCDFLHKCPIKKYNPDKST